MLVSFLVVKKPSQITESELTEVRKYKKKADKADKAEQNAEGKEVQKAADETPKTPKEEEKEFYQPITMRLESPSDGNLFSLITRVVAPAEEVQKHMRSIASRCERAETKYLALRLPRESKDKDVKA